MDLLLHEMISEKVLFIRRDSIVSRQELSDGSTIICKSYQPQNYPEYQNIFGNGGSSPSGSGQNSYIRSYPREYQQSLMNRESAVLEALSSLEPRLVPKYSGKDEKKMEIFMEYIPHPTFQDEFLAAKEDKTKRHHLTEELVETLASFHDVSNTHLDYLKSKAKSGGKKRLQERSVDEESSRWTNYLLTIIYHCSPDFENYCKGRYDLEQSKPKSIRKRVKKFLEDEKKIDLGDLVKEFIEKDREIMGEGKNFVMGDFGPQNVFYCQDRKDIRMFDFDKARLGNQEIDLVSAIHNIHRNTFDKEEEIFSIECAAQYYRRMGVQQENLPEKLAKSNIESRLKQNIRLFSVYCQMNTYEIKKFVGEVKEYDELKNGDLRAAFLDDMFANNFKKFFDYFRQGEEGWHLLLEPIKFDTMKNIQRQLLTIEGLLKDCNVLPLGTISKERLDKFKKIITPL